MRRFDTLPRRAAFALALCLAAFLAPGGAAAQDAARPRPTPADPWSAARQAHPALPPMPEDNAAPPPDAAPLPPDATAPPPDPDTAQAHRAAKAPKAPAPGNPLVEAPDRLLADDGELAAAPVFGQARTAPAPRPRPLTLFGYSFFEPARQIVEAKRAHLRQLYRNPASRDPARPAAPEGVPPSRDASTSAGDASAQPGSDASAQPWGNASAPDGDSGPSPKTARPRADRRSGRPAGLDPAPPRAADADPAPDTPFAGGPAADAVDAFHEVADPISQLYRNVNASVPPDYQLSSGDRLTVRYWSPTMTAREVTRVVDAQGGIQIEGVGRCVVHGLTTAQAEALLRRRLRRQFRGADDSVTLQDLRTIAVTVSGAAFAPGTYVVPAVSSAFNVLYAAGGPAEDGSMRDIQVRRQGQTVGTIDIYKFLTGASKTATVSLQPGDLIYIPVHHARVTLKGEVREPAIFELRDGETLRDALRYASGVKPSGVSQHVQIRTLDPGAARVLKDINLRTASAGRQPLYDGDVVEIFSVRDTLVNQVSVAGSVDQPGEYALEPGMRLSDLLERAHGLLDEAYLTRADLFHWNDDSTQTLVPVDLTRALAHDPAADLTLKRWDRLKVYSRREVAWTGRRSVTVRGAVQRPGAFYLSDNMHVRDILLMAGGTMPDAFLDRAVLLHQHGDGTYNYDYLNLRDLLKADAGPDTLLQDNDVLAVYRVGEAHFTAPSTVTISGQVVSPGVYPRGEGMLLSDLLKLAGGLRPGALTSATVAHAPRADAGADPAPSVIAVRITPGASDICAAGDPRLQDGDVVTIQGTGGFKDHVSFVTVNGAVAHPGPVILTDNMRLSDALKVAGGLRPEAFPVGTEFLRAGRMATAEQQGLTELVSRMNTLINQNTYKRELAKSDLERLKAVQDTQQPAGQSPVAPAPAAAPGLAAATLSGQLAQHDLVSPARALGASDLEPHGSIAVDLTEAMRRPGGAEDITLTDGDTITIPEAPTVVQVVGAVYHVTGITFKPGAPLSYYLTRCGGLTPDAAQDRIEVIRVGGGLIPAGKVRTLQPGDVVLVPTRVLAETLGRRGGDLSSLFRSVTNSAITLKLATSLFGF